MPEQEKARWPREGFFGLHYDLHAKAEDTNLGAEVTPENLREQWEKIKPDFIQCDCKGHPGYTSYPTKVGSPSPGIVKDALRIHRDVTRKMGIPLSVHYSGIWDKRAVELHPEWAAIDSEGKLISPRAEHKCGTVCPRGPYVDDLMIPQLMEIIDEYDIDGIWVDGDNWAVRDCYCARCREEFKRRSGIKTPPVEANHPDWPAWRAFQRDSFVEYVRKYADAVHQRKPTCAVCSNWIYTMRQPGPIDAPVDYISGDFTASFGCERAEMESRYIDGHGVPWNLMAWTFLRILDQQAAQRKPAGHLCQEAAEVMSCGGSVFLYVQPQRSGWLVGWQHDIFAEVAHFCRERQPFCQHTRSAPEAVVLFSDDHVWHRNSMPFCLGDGSCGVEGALHTLIENQFHTDVLDNTRLLERINEYALVVLGEQDPVSPAVLKALAEYAENGGTVLLTGGHIADQCPVLAGVEPAGPMEEGNWCLSVRQEAVRLPGPWRPVRLIDASIYATVMEDEEPSKDATEYPAVTVRKTGKGKVVSIHGKFMETYYLTHEPRLRFFVRDLLDSLDIPRLVKLSAAPSVEVSVRKGKEFTAVHLVNRAVDPSLSNRLHIVEEIPPTGPVEVKLRLEKAPRKITLEPGRRTVDWSYENGWLQARVPSVRIHEILVAED